MVCLLRRGFKEIVKDFGLIKELNLTLELGVEVTAIYVLNCLILESRESFSLELSILCSLILEQRAVLPLVV